MRVQNAWNAEHFEILVRETREPLNLQEKIISDELERIRNNAIKQKIKTNARVGSYISSGSRPGVERARAGSLTCPIAVGLLPVY